MDLLQNLWEILGHVRVFASFFPDGFSDLTGAAMGGGTHGTIGHLKWCVSREFPKS
jgi:hypothetical protein